LYICSFLVYLTTLSQPHVLNFETVVAYFWGAVTSIYVEKIRKTATASVRIAGLGTTYRTPDLQNMKQRCQQFGSDLFFFFSENDRSEYIRNHCSITNRF
jgi:hypothetical protein